MGSPRQAAAARAPEAVSKRTAISKRNPLVKSQQQRSRERLQAEIVSKRKAKQRDLWRCRWPGCTESGFIVEAAHLVGKKMGGDHGAHSHLPKHYVTLGPKHHRMVDQYKASMTPTSTEGGDGPVHFHQKDIHGVMQSVGITAPPDYTF